MKNLFAAIVLSVLLSPVSAQTVNLQQMNQWLADRNYFALKNILSQSHSELSVQDSLYFQASVQNAFGENSASIQTIGKLSDHFANKLDDGAWINLVNILADNYAKNFDYKSTASCYAILIKKYGKSIEKASLEGYQNSFKLYSTLAETAPQLSHLQKNIPIQMEKDQVGLWNVPVAINPKDTIQFVFDSGAGTSTITYSLALQLGLEISPATIQVNSATDKQVMAHLGIAKDLKMGGMIFKNVVFLVMEDQALQFPSIHYQINGIIGFPVIKEMHNISISKNGLLKILPEDNTLVDHPNFFYQGNAIRMMGIAESDTLLFHLDTGAKQSELGQAYFNAHKSFIRRSSDKRKYHLGGAGGVTAYKTYQLPNFVLRIGNGKTATLPYIPVYPDRVSEFGNAIGQDYIQLFETMQIDFDHCNIAFQ